MFLKSDIFTGCYRKTLEIKQVIVHINFFSGLETLSSLNLFSIVEKYIRNL